MKFLLYTSNGKRLIFLFTLLVITSFAYGQRTIKGNVVDDETNEPLIGANILVKGTALGTITDFDGTYELSVPDDATTIVFSYTGYTPQDIEIGASNQIDVRLKAGSILDEVVVIGYGTVKRRDLTGSNVTVGSEDFNRGLQTSPDQLIQGKVAGVQILNNSGAPGAESTIRIRGASSVRTGNQPLFVVDGIPLDGRASKADVDIGNGIGRTPGTNPLSFLNASDIESMQVLKDASATAIYGSRGANGVIIITTKKGRSGAPEVQFDASVGASSLLKKIDLLDGNEYREALREYGLSGTDDGGNVDAFDAITRTGINQNYSLSVTGGSDKGNYRVGISYLDQEGIIEESALERFTGSLKGSYDFWDDRVTLDVSLLASQTNQQSAPVSDNAGFQGNLIGQALQWNPTTPLLLREEVIINGQVVEREIINDLNSEALINPLLMLDAYDDRNFSTRILASISPSVKIAEGLTYKFLYSVDQNLGERRVGMSPSIDFIEYAGVGFGFIGTVRLTTEQFVNTLTYNSEISNNLSLNAVVGYEYTEFKRRSYTTEGRGFPTDEDILDAVDLTDIMITLNQNLELDSDIDPNNELQSFFGRVNLNFRDKYLFTGTVRADGSSKFGDNNEYGVFPSFAFAWNMHNEDFVSGFDNLKLRLGWGQVGNQEFPAGSAQERWEFNRGGSFKLANVANQNLQWETSTTINAGIDFALLDYKLTGTLEYFNKKTEDLLFQFEATQPAPDANVWVNLPGEVTNTGVEIALNYTAISKSNLNLDFGINAGYLTNELNGYEGAPVLTGDINGQGLSGVRSQKLENGQPLYSFFLREHLGLNSEGISEYTNNEELLFLGDPNPDLLLGFTASLRVSDFDFSLNFNGAFGHQLYNNTANALFVIGVIGNKNFTPELLNQTDLDGNSVMEATGNPLKASSRYMEDGDYLKLNNATIGYSFDIPGTWAKRGRVYLTGQNLFVITGYSGFDPEVNTNKEVDEFPSFGIEYLPYPSARTISAGVSVTF